MAEPGDRPRILVLNQYYWPGVEATAHLLTELCESLAEDYEVEVVTGVLHGHEDDPREIERNGVRIVRVSRRPHTSARSWAGGPRTTSPTSDRRSPTRCAERRRTSSSA